LNDDTSTDNRNPVFFIDSRMEQAEVHPFAGGRIALFCVKSPDRESANQDSAALIPCPDRSGVLVVADGVGGYAGGAQASRLAVEAMAEAVKEGVAAGARLRASVLNGIELANKRVRELGTGAATTLAAVLLHDGRMRSFHVGDSDILVVGGMGKMKHRTLSHGPVGYAQEAGLMDEGEAMNHAQRNEVSNIVGIPDMRIEIGPRLRLAQRDTVLLASDGLYDNLFEEEIVERIRKGKLEDCTEALASTSLRRMAKPHGGEPHKPDDLTFILYRRDQAEKR
jgi:serine/threonine protein phosphatase PrpC